MVATFRHSYSWLSILSIDVVAGAVIGASFFASIFSVHIVYELIPLALTVWIIYTVDHLADARKIGHKASTERHCFHQLHFKTLKLIVCVALVIDIISLAFIHEAVIIWGMLLASVVFIFLIIQQRLPWLKEILISLLYSCGVMLPSLAMCNEVLTFAQYLLAIQFAIVALINLLLFSWLDRETDEQDGFNSFMSYAGRKLTKVVIWLLSALELIFTIVQFQIGEMETPSLIPALMSMVLLLIFVSSKSPGSHTVSRFFGDAVFLLPVLYLL